MQSWNYFIRRVWRDNPLHCLLWMLDPGLIVNYCRSSISKHCLQGVNKPLTVCLAELWYYWEAVSIRKCKPHSKEWEESIRKIIDITFVYFFVCEFFKSETYALISLSAWYCKWDMAFQLGWTHKKVNLFPHWIELETWLLFLVDYITLHVACLIFKRLGFLVPKYQWIPKISLPTPTHWCTCLDTCSQRDMNQRRSGLGDPRGVEPGSK